MSMLKRTSISFKNQTLKFVNLLTVLLICLLAACGGRGNTNRVDPVVGDEPAEITVLNPNDENTDLIIMQGHNYIFIDDDSTANILNIVNMSQFRELVGCQEVMDDLAVDNFAILSDTLPQLFQVYQQNASLQIPNFVITDLFVQLSHIYETYVLQTVEERYFSPLLTELCIAMYNASMDQFNKATKEDIREMAARNAAFYAVPYHLLTGKSLKIPGDYQMAVEEEVAYIDQQEDRRPTMLFAFKTDFAYSAFKPYGHYTRTAVLRRYFKAWKWLQLAPYSSDKARLQQAVMAATALKTAKTQSGTAAMAVYSRLSGAMNWFIGQPAYGSLLDMTNRSGIYFLPQPARMDDELLHAMVDPKPDAQKAFPDVSDIFAALGSKPAFHQWNVSSYNKRLECLSAMQQKPASAPVFARKQAWNRKKLETASASWVKMKHDALLYGIIPDHPDPLDTVAVRDTLPVPVKLGYVEPALPFWTKLREWVELTEETLKKYHLMTDTIETQTALLHRYVTLMETAAQKELDNESPDDGTYRFMAHIGDSIEQFTLSMITPEIDRWEWAAGTDQSIAVCKKVYRRNVKGCPKNGDLYAATGNVGNIYVMVEIDGYLYLTKGAMFKFHEFSMPKGKELNETDWKNMLFSINNICLNDTLSLPLEN